MKLKGSAKSLKLIHLFYGMAVGTVLALGVRIWQVFNIIEPETGFFSEINFTVVLLYAILGICAVFAVLGAFLTPEVPEPRMVKGRNIPVAVSGVLMSGTLMYDCVVRFADFNSALNVRVTLYEQQTLMKYLMNTGALPKLLEGIFAAVSAVYFIFIAMQYFGAKSIDCSKLRLLAVCPLFWATCRLIQRFTRTISFVNVSDLLLELFMIAFTMLFFMNYAQVCSHINDKGIMFKVYGYGLTAILFSAVVAVPRVILFFVNNNLTVEAHPLEFCDLAVPLFVGLYLLALLKVPMERNVSVKENDVSRKDEEA